MFHSNNMLLTFASEWGSFRIEPDEHKDKVFTLSIETEGEAPLMLGYHFSVNDAIFAVAQQKTGYAIWDQLKPEDLPRRIHNIACWKFQQNLVTNLGTFPRAACS